MSITYSAWFQLQYNLAQDFLDLLFPPAYPFLTALGGDGSINQRVSGLASEIVKNPVAQSVVWHAATS